MSPDWDAADLEAACRTLASFPAGSISRIHVVVPYPAHLNGGLAVLRRARVVAHDFGFEAHGDSGMNQITITFERTCTVPGTQSTER